MKNEKTIIALIKEHDLLTAFDIAAKGKLVLADVQKELAALVKAEKVCADKIGNTVKYSLPDEDVKAPAKPKADKAETQKGLEKAAEELGLKAPKKAKAKKAAPKAPKAADKGNGKASNKKAATAPKTPKGEKPKYKDAVTGIEGIPNCRVDRPGVVKSLEDMLRKNKGKWVSRTSLHNMLTKKFADRSPSSLNTTISNMLSGQPCRIEKDCKRSDKKEDITIVSKSENGERFWMCIK